MKRNLGPMLAAPALALSFAMAVSALLLVVTGYSAREVFAVIIDEGFSRTYLVDTFNRAGPYYIGGVAVAIGFKMNLFNIGVEGQYRLAAMIAAAAGAAVSLPSVLHIGFILIVAMVVGAAWAFIPAILKTTRGVSEVISSIMLNSIAIGLAAFVLERWLRQPAAESPVLGTKPMDSTAQLPTLNGILGSIGIDIPGSTRVNAYTLLAIVVGVAFYVIIWKTRFGYDLRASGSNAEAATASGVNAKRMVITAMLLSGATAGLIGLGGILGTAGRYNDVSVVGGLGFSGIAIALLGRNNPIGIAFAAILWSFMDAIQAPLSNAELPKQITGIMQSITVLSVVIAYEVVRRIGVRREAAGFRKENQAQPDPPPAIGGAEVAPA